MRCIVAPGAGRELAGDGVCWSRGLLFMSGKNNLGISLRKPELLAPAGTAEAFAAALDAGADAVYVGLKELSARAFAQNFTLSELAELLKAARKKGSRVFVAMNSLFRQEEMDIVVRQLAGLEMLGVDGLIIQDLGLWRLVRRYFPSIPLHASTLMTIHNSLGVIQAHRMGFKRVVLAREMTMEEIGAAAAAAPIETEVFIHGALCFSYSGLCLFSSYFGGRSSMRGECVQPCRRLYSWSGKKGRYFSMGDLCALDFVWDLARAGVKSFKIEGRLRPPSYVFNVVRAYRIVIDARPGDHDALGEARDLLRRAMGRAYTRGYFNGPIPKDAISPSRTANTGARIGRVVKVLKSKELLVRAACAVSKGDRLRLVHGKKDVQEVVRCTGVSGQGRDLCLKVTGWPRGFDPKDALVFRADVQAGSKYRAGHLLKKGRLPKKYRERVERKVRDVLEQLAGKGADDSSGLRSPREPELWARLGTLRSSAFWKRSRPRSVMLEPTLGNLRSVSGRKAGRMEVVWCLPPVIHESGIPFYLDMLARLMNLGYRRYQIGEIGQLILLEKAWKKAESKRRPRIEIWGDYTLNLLNSQAVEAAGEMGMKQVQFSVETGQENLEQAISACKKDVEVALTVFGFPPLFTSRMTHRSYDESRPVASQRDERFFWRRDKGLGRLVSAKPFSFLGKYQLFRKLGLFRLIVDVSLWPKGKRCPQISSWNADSLRRILKGGWFNFKGVGGR